jgi:hypothetical protein
MHVNMEEDEEVGHDGLPEGQDLRCLLQIGENFAILVEKALQQKVSLYAK